MLLRLCPQSSLPTILFTLALPALPDDLPLPAAWAQALDTLLTHDLPPPPSAQALDIATGHVALVERVTFDLVAASVSCVWLDGRTTLHQLSDECVRALESVVHDVSLASIEAQREQHRELLAKEQRSCPPTPPSSLNKPPPAASSAAPAKHKRRRSTFFSMVSAILTTPSSNAASASPAPSADPEPTQAQTTPSLPLPDALARQSNLLASGTATVPVVASDSRPESPSSQIEQAHLALRGPRSRYLRRRARSLLVDSFVRFVLPLIRVERQPYELWTITSLLRRTCAEGHLLLKRALPVAERAGLRHMIPAIPRFDDNTDELLMWPFQSDDDDSDMDEPIIDEDTTSGTRSSLEDGSLDTPRDDIENYVDIQTASPVVMSPEDDDDDPFFTADTPRAKSMHLSALPPRRRPAITPVHIARAELCAFAAEYRALQTHASRLRVLRMYLAAQRERVSAEETAYNDDLEKRAVRRACSGRAFHYTVRQPADWAKPPRSSPLSSSLFGYELDSEEEEDGFVDDSTSSHAGVNGEKGGYISEEEAAADVSAARARRRALGMRRARSEWSVAPRRHPRRPDAPYRRAALLASAAKTCFATVPFPTMEEGEIDAETLYSADESLRFYREDMEEEGAEDEIEVSSRRFSVPIDFPGIGRNDDDEDSDDEDPFSDQNRLESFPVPPSAPLHIEADGLDISSPTTESEPEVLQSDVAAALRSAVRKRLPSMSFSLPRPRLRKVSTESQSSHSSAEESVPKLILAPVTVSPPRPPPRAWTGRRIRSAPIAA